MTNDVLDFLIHGHEKVISHYKFLLASRGLSQSERALIQERLRREEAAYQQLIESGGRHAA